MKNLIRFVVSDARDEDALLRDLRLELDRLVDAPSTEIETTLLIHPHVLADFFEFNDFLDSADALVEELGYTGDLQIASFHPRYQFAGSAATDVTNADEPFTVSDPAHTREDSIERALTNVSSPDAIYQNNLLTLRALGSGRLESLGRAIYRRAGALVFVFVLRWCSSSCSSSTRSAAPTFIPRFSSPLADLRRSSRAPPNDPSRVQQFLQTF